LNSPACAAFRAGLWNDVGHLNLSAHFDAVEALDLASEKSGGPLTGIRCASLFLRCPSVRRDHGVGARYLRRFRRPVSHRDNVKRVYRIYREQGLNWETPAEFARRHRNSSLAAIPKQPEVSTSDCY